MSEALRPASEAELEDMVRDALARTVPLSVRGGGTKAALGRPCEGQGLDLSALTGIVKYEPEELVLTARAGTPMTEVAVLLEAKSQMLAFEPPDHSALFGVDTARATLGGAVACGLSGPRRVRAGAVRDHMLGVRAISGRAETFMAGGRVVKNVTGYDLPKLLTGSYGTLAVMTELTLKVMPAPETEATVTFDGLSDAPACRAMIAAMQSACDVSGAAHFEANGASTTAFRLEGFGPSVNERKNVLVQELSAFGAAKVLLRDESRALWKPVRDVSAFASEPVVWRAVVPPANAAEVAARLKVSAPRTRLVFDWGGALIWLAPGELAQETVRSAVSAADGHAMLFKAPEGVRASADVFHPLPQPLFQLTKRIKQQFDPAGILNPGRMHPGL